MSTTLRAAERLVGLPYVAGEFDCVDLAVHAQRELFGRFVAINVRHPLGARGQAAAILRHRQELTEPVVQASTGDVVLFTERDDQGHLCYHVGTVLVEPDQLWVLHTREGASSVLQPIKVCLRQGLQLEGFYRWK